MNNAGPFSTGPAVGTSGSAEASSETQYLNGVIIGVAVHYTFGAEYYTTSTVDLTITTRGTNGAPISREILTLSGAGTDGWFYPVLPVQDTQGADIVGQFTLGIPVSDVINIAIEAADPGDSVDVWFQLAE